MAISVPAFFLPMLIYKIQTSYDPMNFAVELDPYYNTDFPRLEALTGFELAVATLTHNTFRKKYWELQYLKVALCVEDDLVVECPFAQSYFNDGGNEFD